MSRISPISPFRKKTCSLGSPCESAGRYKPPPLASLPQLPTPNFYNSPNIPETDFTPKSLEIPISPRSTKSRSLSDHYSGSPRSYVSTTGSPKASDSLGESPRSYVWSPTGSPNSSDSFDVPWWTPTGSPNSFSSSDDDDEVITPLFPIISKPIDASIFDNLPATGRSNTRSTFSDVEESRSIRRQQDLDYEESMRIDLEKAETKRMVTLNEERRLLSIQNKNLEEERIKASMKPAVLLYPLGMSEKRDIVVLRFRLKSGDVVNHSFNRREPLKSVIQQLKFDMKFPGDLKLLVLPWNKEVNCDPDDSIESCGIETRSTLVVEYY